MVAWWVAARERGAASARESATVLCLLSVVRAVLGHFITAEWKRVRELRSACGRGQARTVLWTVLLRGQHVVVSSVIVV